MDNNLSDSLNQSPSQKKSRKKKRVKRKVITRTRVINKGSSLADDPSVRFFINVLKLVFYSAVLTLWLYMLTEAKKYWASSLENCDGDIVVCLIRMQHNFTQIINSCLICASLIFAVMIMGLHMPNPIVKIMGVGVPLGIAIYMNKTCNWVDHSQGNLLFMQATWFFYTLLYLTVLGLYKLYHRNLRVFSGLMVLIVIFAAEFLKVRVFSSCETLEDGIVPGFGRNHNNGECKWNTTDICWHVTTYKMSAPLYWGRDNCKAMKQDMKQYSDKVRESGLKIIQFPNIPTMDIDQWKHVYKVQEAVINGAKPISEQEMLNGPNEVFIDFRKDLDQGEVVIMLKKITDQAFLEDSTKFPSFLNIFVDTVSRPRFHRRFKKLAKFIQKYHYSKDGDYLAYEFHRLHSNRGYTSPNLCNAIEVERSSKSTFLTLR